jgi:hypothetical protein
VFSSEQILFFTGYGSECLIRQVLWQRSHTSITGSKDFLCNFFCYYSLPWYFEPKKWNDFALTQYNVCWRHNPRHLEDWRRDFRSIQKFIHSSVPELQNDAYWGALDDFSFETVDYRCVHGRFPVSTSSGKISTRESISSSGTGGRSRNKSCKKHSSEWARCQKAVGGIYFTKKWSAETLQPGLEFDNLKPRPQSGIFKCTSRLNESFFFLLDDDRCFLKEGVETYPMTSIWTLNSPTSFFVFTSIV